MGHIDIASVEYSLSDGRVLLNDVSFRVGDGAKVALMGRPVLRSAHAGLAALSAVNTALSVW